MIHYFLYRAKDLNFELLMYCKSTCQMKHSANTKDTSVFGETTTSTIIY